MTLNETYSEWIGIHKRTIKEGTYIRYNSTYNNSIKDTIGNEEISKISHKEINEFLVYLSQRNSERTLTTYSPSSINACIAVLKLIFRYAIENEYIDSSPMEGIGRINIDRRVNYLKLFSIQDQMMLQAYVKTNLNIYTAAILIDLYTGLRIGELVALKWEDVDLNKMFIYVDQTAYMRHDEDDNMWYEDLGDPKTTSAKRFIPIMDELKDIFEYLESIRNSEYVFSIKGYRMNSKSLRYYFNKYLTKLGIDHKTFHSLRHTFATRLIEFTDIKTVSELLGHSNPNITLAVYTHTLDERKYTAINKLSSFYKQAE